MEFAEKVKALLERHRMSQAELAKAIGTHQPQISKWLNDGVTPSTPLALRVARTFHVPLDYLMDDEMEEVPVPELTEDERSIVELYRDLEIGKREAIKRLARPLDVDHPPVPGEASVVDAVQARAGTNLDRDGKKARKRG